MVQGFFVNVGILITFIFLSSQTFGKSGLSLKSAIGSKIKLGLIGGITASVLIRFIIQIDSGPMIEFLDKSIILVTIFGGFLPAMITGSIAALLRLTYFGVSSDSMIYFHATIIFLFGCRLITLVKLKEKTKGIVLLLISLIIRSISYFLIINSGQNLLLVIAITWIASILMALIVYYVVQYLVKAHNLLNRLKNESTHDYLTGLYNTRRFDLKYNDAIKDTIDKMGKVSLLIIDIDHYKSVNDTYGHMAGDAVLKELGLVLMSSSRKDDVVSRIGGEEFAIVMKNLNKEDTLTVAERIRSNIESHPFLLPDNNIINITVSVGVAVYPDTIEDIKDLKETADSKLYEAKRTGRNKVCF